MRHLALILCVLLVPALASAQSVDERKRAKHHYKQGKAFYDAGQFDKAVDEYRKAQALTNEPLLLFNIALAYDKNGDAEQAHAHYQQYLELEPDGKASQIAREAVVKLAPVVEAAEAERKRQEAEARQAEEERSKAATPPEPQVDTSVTTAPPDAPKRSGRKWKIAGIATAGAGVVALGLGVKFGLDAKSAADDVSAHDEGAWTPALLEREEEGQRAETRMVLFTAVGGVALLTGAVFYYFGHSAESETHTVAVTPIADATGGAVVWSGSF